MQQNHKNPPQNYNEIIDNLMLQDNKHIAKILQCSTRTIQRQRKDNKLAAYMLRHIHYILNSVYTLQNDLYNKSDVVISKMENTTKNMGSVKNSHTTNDIAINNATTMSPTPNYNGDKKRHSNDNDMSVDDRLKSLENKVDLILSLLQGNAMATNNDRNDNDMSVDDIATKSDSIYINNSNNILDNSINKTYSVADTTDDSDKIVVGDTIDSIEDGEYYETPPPELIDELEEQIFREEIWQRYPKSQIKSNFKTALANYMALSVEDRGSLLGSINDVVAYYGRKKSKEHVKSLTALIRERHWLLVGGEEQEQPHNNTSSNNQAANYNYF